MARLKKPIDYVNELILNPNSNFSKLGENLQRQYERWTRSLNLRDLLNFVKTIQDNKDKIGVAQYFGKFRAYSFEEYVFRLIQAKVVVPKNFGVFWGEKCLVWKEKSREYGMELDVITGKKLDRFVEPKVVVDAKVELDASRLKTTLASFVLLKRQFPKVKCFLVYIYGNIDSLLLDLAKPFIDGIYQFTPENDEVNIFINLVQNVVETP